jgi:hypothetical protein
VGRGRGGDDGAVLVGVSGENFGEAHADWRRGRGWGGWLDGPGGGRL